MNIYRKGITSEKKKINALIIPEAETGKRDPWVEEEETFLIPLKCNKGQTI